MSNTKSFSGYLIINWKDDDVRFRKSKPGKKKRSPYEIPVEVEFDVEIPEFDIPTLSKTFEVPEVEVKEAVGEMVELDSIDEDEDLPDPRHLLVTDYENIKYKWTNEFEPLEDREDSLDEVIDWTRKCLSYEYKNSNRENVVEFLEQKLLEYKQRAD